MTDQAAAYKRVRRNELRICMDVSWWERLIERTGKAESRVPQPPTTEGDKVSKPGYVYVASSWRCPMPENAATTEVAR